MFASVGVSLLQLLHMYNCHLKICFLLVFSCLSLVNMEGNGADIGFLYFIELKHNEKVYYIQYGTYAHIDESLNVVNGFDTDVVNLNSSGIKNQVLNGNISVYSKINIVRFKQENDFLPKMVFSFSEVDRISTESFKVDELEFTRVIGEGTPGEFYSKDLMKDEFDWYNQIKVEQLFSVDVGMCYYQFFGNKSFYEAQELSTWSKEVEAILRREDMDDIVSTEFDDFARYLYDLRIFYIGICSC